MNWIIIDRFLDHDYFIQRGEGNLQIGVIGRTSAGTATGFADMMIERGKEIERQINQSINNQRMTPLFNQTNRRFRYHSFCLSFMPIIRMRATSYELFSVQLTRENSLVRDKKAAKTIVINADRSRVRAKSPRNVPSYEVKLV